MLICCPPSLITSLRQTFIISGQFSSLPITEKALLCVVWAGGRAPVPTTKIKGASSFLPAVPRQSGPGAWTTLSRWGTPPRA